MISEFLDARDEYSRRLKCSDRIHSVGIGVGLRVVAGRRLPELSVQVFVPKKTAPKELSWKERIPPSIDGVSIDVLESTAAMFSGLPALEVSRSRALPMTFPPGRAKRRPLVAGISCSNLYSSSGTLGCFCEGLNREGRHTTFILGCGHVLRGRESFKTSRAVIQASPADGGTSRDAVAIFERDVPLVAGPNGVNLCDAAIAEISSSVSYSNNILGIGTPCGKSQPQPGMKVQKSGRTTGVTAGVVTAVALETWISWSFTDPHTRYRFADLVRVENEVPGVPFALPGDSGALIVTEAGRLALALYFAGANDGSYGLASPITAIENNLDVQLTASGLEPQN